VNVKAKALALCLLLCGAALLSTAALADDEKEQIRQTLLAQINADRAQYGLSPVELEPLASTVADYHALEMLAGDYLSHWNEWGLKPYQRYSLAGGYYYTEENVFYFEQHPAFDNSAATLTRLCLLGQASFMDEEPPRDGHRRSILNPWHTHVGIGFAASANAFRLVEFFTRHWVELSSPAERVFTLAQQVQVSGRAPTGFAVQSVAVFFENLPQPMDLQGKKVAASYSFPPQRRDLFLVLPPPLSYTDGTRGSISIDGEGNFSFLVPFYQGVGVYTVVVWLLPAGSQEPIATTALSLFVVG